MNTTSTLTLLMLLTANSLPVFALAADPKPNTSIIPDDRKIDWTLAGIPGGIPNRSTIFRTIDADKYGNGSTNATKAIQSATDECPADQVVLLPAGTYLTSETIHLRSDKTLRGAGQGRTIIKYRGKGGRSVVDLKGGAYDDIFQIQHISAITAGAGKNSKQITLASAEGIAVGDVLLIDELNDPELVDIDGSQGKCTYCSREKGERSRGQLVEVAGVNGNTVDLNLPLFFSLSPDRKPEAVKIRATSIIRRAGVEDLTVMQDQPVNKFLIEIEAAQYCWLKNLELTGMDLRAVEQILSLQDEIRDCTIHFGLTGYGRDHGYGILMRLQDTALLIENNILDTVDGAGIMTEGGAIGNVIAYNYLRNIQFLEPTWMIAGPGLNHGAHPSMNLWEGNVGQQIGNDFIHGSSSHNTVFRSRSTGYRDREATENNNAVDFEYKNRYMTVMGCVLGTEGFTDVYEIATPDPDPSTTKTIWRLGYTGPNYIGDPEVKATLLRHGNWDAVTKSTHWDPNIADHTLPPSLYRSEKPSWWGDLPWPAIGPDVPGLVSKIPAEVRFEKEAAATSQ